LARSVLATLSLHDALPIFRKVIGSRQRQIMGLFVSEAIVVTAIASIAAIFLVIMCLPGFNDLTGKQLTIAGLGAKWAIPAFIGRSEEHTSELQSRENLVCR